ncbi:MAG: methyltransferase domain-containing protein [Candidatus Magasanikbacteria bacterium]|nr:methyltransferase domain-containing protein [Candidatus Magasanikbacteria bacterium]
MFLTEKQLTEKSYYNSIVHDKWDSKSLLVERDNPPFSDYSGDLFDCAKKYISDFKNKTILEIGCGNGEISVWFAKNGANVYGLDISDESISIAKRRSIENEVSEKTNFSVSPAENTNFQDNFFDIVFINVSLHHLEVEKALNEIKRILKPNGIFVTIEPFVFSNTIQKIRTSKLIVRLYPIRQETPTERILFQNDLKLIQNIFSTVEYKPYRIFSLFILKIKPLFFLLADIFHQKELSIENRRRLMNRKIQNIDEAILRYLPFMKFLSRYIVIKAKINKL